MELWSEDGMNPLFKIAEQSGNPKKNELCRLLKSYNIKTLAAQQSNPKGSTLTIQASKKIEDMDLNEREMLLQLDEN